MSSETPDWRIYERFVHSLLVEEAEEDRTVIPNATLVGSISGVKRQIDVLIDARWEEDVSRRVIVDAKRYKSKVDVKDVESFEGMMRDCRAQHGILVCPHGYTAAALKRAQNTITIKLVPLSDLDEFDFGSWQPCVGACCTKNRMKSQGLVLWEMPYGLAVAAGQPDTFAIVATGKCDVCRNFHVWCWDCGETFALKDKDEYKCSCDRFWLTSIEEEIDDAQGEATQAVHLLLVLLSGAVIFVDRRKLR